MGKGFRKDRLASELVKETSKLLISELRDPRLGFVTVTRAKVSDDYRTATVYISVMGTPRQKKLSLSGLRHASGFVQKELTRRIPMRIFPVVRFELDETIDKSFKVTEMLNALAKERKERQAKSGETTGGEGEEE